MYTLCNIVVVILISYVLYRIYLNKKSKKGVDKQLLFWYYNSISDSITITSDEVNMKEVKKSTNIADGVNALISAANADYTDKTNHDGLSYDEQSDSSKEISDEMNKTFTEGWIVSAGSKYIRLRTNGFGTWGFVVATDNDKLFKKGDLLKPAGYDKPARNAPRGNVLKGNFPINWTGPLYLN